MKKALQLPIAAAAMLALFGCGASLDTAFSKRGTSLTAQKSDSDQCWKIAQASNITSGEAATDMAAGWFFFGIAGAVVASSATEEARKDPKNYHRRKVHDECMMGRGYKKVE